MTRVPWRQVEELKKGREQEVLCGGHKGGKMLSFLEAQSPACPHPTEEVEGQKMHISIAPMGARGPLC